MGKSSVFIHYLYILGSQQLKYKKLFLLTKIYFDSKDISHHFQLKENLVVNNKYNGVFIFLSSGGITQHFMNVPKGNRVLFPHAKHLSVPQRKTLRLFLFHRKIKLTILRGDSHCVLIMARVLNRLQLISKCQMTIYLS